ncbi:alpha/beta hydrolase family esterase [Roseovarius nitratireducens]|uniref:alpha/beta hydrolase family esterase n=1 Tax=Roseovarius nitratireducens TaxID=2044597 RepID=UPI000CE16CB4|nr:alpha/beta fold hydrolase [Roseovarius nitratireducens]
MRHALAIAFLALITPAPALAAGQVAPRCHAEVPCALGDRSYHVKEPDGWDGKTPLPVLLHFHGWMRQGTLIVKHGRISGATRRRGVLLLAPNGQGKTWDFWTDRTDDVDFAAAVIEDAAKRYPIDRSRIYVSGYSYGSAMAWRYACENGDGVAALLAVSGTLRQSETCAQAPQEVRHVHGTSDTVMDFPFGPNGETTWPVRLWRGRMGCAGPGERLGKWSVTDHDTFARTTWDCDDGRIVLDVHSRGHFIPRGWIARQLDEMLDLPPSYP